MKRKPGVLRLLGALALLGLLGLAAAGVIGSILAKKGTEKQPPFLFDAYAENSFASLGDGLLAVSDVELRSFDGLGAPLSELNRSFPQALIAAKGDAAVVWSQSGTGACLLRADGSHRDLTLGGTLVSADVNEGGWQVYLTAESGYRGVVTAYDPEGTATYRLYTTSSYPLDADISPNAAQLALLSMTGSGSRVALYRLDEEEERAAWEAEGALFFDLEYLSDTRMVLLSADRAVFLDGSCQQVGAYDFQDEYLLDYALDGGGFVTLALGRYRAGSAGRLVTLDFSGSELAALEVDQEVEGLSAAGEHLAVLYRNKAVLYSARLEPAGSLDNTAGIQAALARKDGTAIIVSGAVAAIFEP